MTQTDELASSVPREQKLASPALCRRGFSYETLELEKGESPVRNALDQDRRCGDRLHLCSPIDWITGSILGCDCHARCDAIHLGHNAFSLRLCSDFHVRGSAVMGVLVIVGSSLTRNPLHELLN